VVGRVDNERVVAETPLIEFVETVVEPNDVEETFIIVPGIESSRLSIGIAPRPKIISGFLCKIASLNEYYR
jgi:hypothetical protein